MGRPGKKHIRLGVAARPPRGLFADLDGSPLADFAALTPSLPDGFDSSEPEESYARLVSSAHRRRLGQFFTPQPIAELLCRWVAEIRPHTMLDPAAGTGILPRTMHQIAKECRIAAIEVDSMAAQALSQVADPSWRDGISQCDFLTWEEPATFDAVVANPPYLRHHDMCYPDSVWRNVERNSGVKLSRLTNIYVLFILEICRRLRPGGRAAIIVPGEWLNANFGRPLKEFLLRGAWLRQLVYFSHAETLFADALTTACLLFIERPQDSEPTDQLRTLFVASSARLEDVQRLVLNEVQSSDGVVERSFGPAALLAHAKWNSVLEYGLPTPVPGFVPLAELATTRRGIATGANSFFHLSRADARSRGLGPKHLRPCIGRARDVVGYVFRAADFDRLESEAAATQLFAAEGELAAAEREYLAEGERAGLPERYLLSQRSPWYTMERREPAPIWAAVFGRTELRFVSNEAGISNLTTFHAIYPRRCEEDFVRALTACLNSGVVQERARLQQRVYGGGLLKFEPRDLLEIQVPDLRAARPETIALLAECLAALDDAAKNGDQIRRSDALARLNDAAIIAAQEASGRVPLTELEDQSALGPLWAQRTHRDGPGA